MAALNLRKFTNPDFLRTISPSHLRAFLEFWRGYLLSRGLDLSHGGETDCENLARLLVQPDGGMPKDMIDALYYVHETCSDEDMDCLLTLANSRHVLIDHEPHSTVADVAIQVWLAAPDLLREHHAESIAFRQKNFLYYGGAYPGNGILPVVTDELRLRIEAALDDWFEKHRRGRGSHVFFFPQQKKVWILVRHGMPFRREASHHDDGHSSTEIYRPQQHDVLVYDAAENELSVHAGTKGETKLYLSCLGQHLFGDENYFPAADKFSLDPLLEDGAKSLLCEDIEGLEAIRLVEYRRFWGGAYQEVEIRKATDICASLTMRGQVLGSRGRLVSATFKVKFIGVAKERAVTIRPPGNAKYERNEDSELIEAWLAKRGFIPDAEVDDDDDEKPETLLASA